MLSHCRIQKERKKVQRNWYEGILQILVRSKGQRWIVEPTYADPISQDFSIASKEKPASLSAYSGSSWDQICRFELQSLREHSPRPTFWVLCDWRSSLTPLNLTLLIYKIKVLGLFLNPKVIGEENREWKIEILVHTIQSHSFILLILKAIIICWLDTRH